MNFLEEPNEKVGVCTHMAFYAGNQTIVSKCKELNGNVCEAQPGCIFNFDNKKESFCTHDKNFTEDEEKIKMCRTMSETNCTYDIGCVFTYIEKPNRQPGACTHKSIHNG